MFWLYFFCNWFVGYIKRIGLKFWVRFLCVINCENVDLLRVSYRVFNCFVIRYFLYVVIILFGVVCFLLDVFM